MCKSVCTCHTRVYMYTCVCGTHTYTHICIRCDYYHTYLNAPRFERPTVLSCAAVGGQPHSRPSLSPAPPCSSWRFCGSPWGPCTTASTGTEACRFSPFRFDDSGLAVRGFWPTPAKPRATRSPCPRVNTGETSVRQSGSMWWPKMVKEIKTEVEFHSSFCFFSPSLVCLLRGGGGYIQTDGQI